MHEILFHMLQKNRTRLLPIVQQTNLNLALRQKNFFAQIEAKQIYAKEESAANGNFKQYSETDIFIKRAYFNSA